MRGKSSQCFVRIDDFLDRLGNWFLPALAGIIAAIFGTPDFFESMRMEKLDFLVRHNFNICFCNLFCCH